MLPALEPSGAGPQGETVPWTISVLWLLSELVMVVAKLTSLLCSEHGQDQTLRAPLSSSQPTLCSHHLFPIQPFCDRAGPGAGQRFLASEAAQRAAPHLHWKEQPAVSITPCRRAPGLRERLQHPAY